MDQILARELCPSSIPTLGPRKPSFFPALSSRAGDAPFPFHFLSSPSQGQKDMQTQKLSHNKSENTGAWEVGWWCRVCVTYGSLFLSATEHQCKRKHDKNIQNTHYEHTHTHTLNQYENFCSSPNTDSRRPSGKIEIVKSKAIKYISNYFDCKFPLPYWIFIIPTKLSGTTTVQGEKEMQLYQNGD